MPDIFGNTPESYTLVKALQEQDAWERWEQATAERHGFVVPKHDFNALKAGVPKEYMRATQDQQAVGYLTNNLLTIQTEIDEILYTNYRLPSYVHINTSIEEGARSYGIRVRDRVGKAQRISGPGWEAPSATASESLVTHPIFWYGLDAEWSIDELRGAMMTGFPLDTESVEAATMGSLERMEETALLGELGWQGLLNLSITGTDAVNHIMATNKFSTMSAVEIRTLINGRLSNVIEITKETFGRNVNQGMTVYLPGPQYDELTNKYIGDDAEKTVMKSIMEDNPWTHFTKGQKISIERVLELSGIGSSGTDRMVVALKNGRVCEMGVSISPRVLRTMDKGRVICAQLESKYSPLFVKRPHTIQYVDGI